jgi:hypothetical protein
VVCLSTLCVAGELLQCGGERGQVGGAEVVEHMPTNAPHKGRAGLTELLEPGVGEDQPPPEVQEVAASRQLCAGR